MRFADDEELIRVGELSRRLGVSAQVLRNWESRYGLPQPARSEGGFRLYSPAEEARLRAMQAHLARGLSPAEAARAVLAQSAHPTPQARPDDGAAAVLPEFREALRTALDSYDELAAQAVIDRMLSDLSLRTVLRGVVLPYLRELGERWADGTASVAQEHFASTVIRGRLAGLARGWGGGFGPVALLACPPEELHELGLMAFGLVLHQAGWRVHYLGTSTPIEELLRRAEQVRYDRVVLAATMPGTLARSRAPLKKLTAAAPVALAGADASARFAAIIGAEWLSGDPVGEAERLATAVAIAGR